MCARPIGPAIAPPRCPGPTDWTTAADDGRSRPRCAMQFPRSAMRRPSETIPLGSPRQRSAPTGEDRRHLRARQNDRFASGGPWARDLARDLDVIVDWGARALVALLEPEELAWLAIMVLGAEVERRGLEWLHLLIRDVHISGSGFEAKWPAASERLRVYLRLRRKHRRPLPRRPWPCRHDIGASTGRDGCRSRRCDGAGSHRPARGD